MLFFFLTITSSFYTYWCRMSFGFKLANVLCHVLTPVDHDTSRDVRWQPNHVIKYTKLGVVSDCASLFRPLGCFVTSCEES